jgi:cell division protein FtsW
MGISILTLFGLLMVYSASMVVAAERAGSPSYYFVRQSLHAVAGYLLMIVLMLVDYHKWLKLRTILYLAAFSLTSLLLVFHHAPIKGAHRALRIDLVSFQPSELAKLVILFYVAYFLQKQQEIRHAGLRLLPCIFFVGLFTGLIVLEPDLGQALCILFIVTLLFFIAGLDWKYIAIAALPLLPLFYFFTWKVPFRRARILAWLAALRDPLNADYHTRQTAIAVGRGGFLGVGFGKSRQKFFFLPEVIGDSIYALIGEELGLVGAVLVLAAYLGYLILGAKISIKAPDRGGFYLGLGIALMLALQAFVNMSTALAIVPNKGLTLPFISQGGSSLVVSLMATGILLNISSQRKTHAEDGEQPLDEQEQI